jgi:predicted nucleic acid-binding protein
MATFFFESSALVKRYVSETGSAWVNSLIAAATADDICLASLTSVEVISAIARRRLGGTIAPADAGLLIAQWRHEMSNDFLVVEITPMLISRAMNLAEKHALRGSDAVQLAVALEVQQQCLAAKVSLTVISADAELNSAAIAEGLTVENPNSHP